MNPIEHLQKRRHAETDPLVRGAIESEIEKRKRKLAKPAAVAKITMGRDGIVEVRVGDKHQEFYVAGGPNGKRRVERTVRVVADISRDRSGFKYDQMNQWKRHTRYSIRGSVSYAAARQQLITQCENESKLARERVAEAEANLKVARALPKAEQEWDRIERRRKPR